MDSGRMCERLQRGAAVKRAGTTETSAVGQFVFDKIARMGVTIELQNLGDAQLCCDIAAYLEHAFSGRQGEWRVSIAGSRVAASWGLASGRTQWI